MIYLYIFAYIITQWWTWIDFCFCFCFCFVFVRRCPSRSTRTGTESAKWPHPRGNWCLLQLSRHGPPIRSSPCLETSGPSVRPGHTACISLSIFFLSCVGIHKSSHVRARQMNEQTSHGRARVASTTNERTATLISLYVFNNWWDFRFIFFLIWTLPPKSTCFLSAIL